MPANSHPLRPKALALSALAAALLLQTACKPEQPPPAEPAAKVVRYFKVGEGNWAGASYPGVASARDSVQLSFRVPGRIEGFPVSPADEVAKDQLLCKLDPADFQTKVDDLTGKLERAKAELSSMDTARSEEIVARKADLNAKEAEVTRAKTDLERYEKLLADGVASQAEYDQVNTTYQVALGQRDVAQEQLRVAEVGAREEDRLAKESEIKSLAAQLQQAQNDLSYTELKSPYEVGLIARKYPDTFQEVKAGDPIVLLQNISFIDIPVFIPESDMTGKALMQSIEEIADSIDANAAFTALPGQVFGVRLKEYETQADPDTQTYKVTLTMPQPEDLRILPGMNATVRLAQKRAVGEEPILVPAAAVVADPAGGKVVWVVGQDSRVSKRTVQGDRMVGEFIEVTSGLEVGDVVAASAANLLREGDAVKEMPDLGSL